MITHGYTKLLTGIFAVFSVIGYGVFVFAAQLPDGTPPPLGGYALGGDTILDPGCAPGGTDCLVRQFWEVDTVNGYVFNTGQNIGIGTNTPSTSLAVQGSFSTGLDTGSITSYFLNDDVLFGQQGIFFGVNSSVTGWNTYGQLVDSIVEFGLYDNNGESSAGIGISYDLNENAKLSMTADSATDTSAGSLYHTAGFEMDERGISAYTNIPDRDSLVQIHSKTGTLNKSETWITTDWADDMDINNMVDSGSVGIYMMNDRTPANTSQFFYRTNISVQDTVNSITLGYEYFTITTDYNALFGPALPTGPGDTPAYAFFPSSQYSNILGSSQPDTTINTASQDNYSAMMYAPDRRNLFFWTDPTGAQSGTGDWEPVSPFERDPVTNRVTLFDSNDAVGIGAVPNSGDRLLVLGDIKIGDSGVNGCVRDFSGGTITGTCSSDERLKTNIVSVENILDKLTNIQLVTYDWNTTAVEKGFTGGVAQLGVLAQDVEQEFPELVVTDKNGFKQVNYARLGLLNLEAIKELKLRIENVATTAQSVTGVFVENLKAWLGDAMNGLERIVSKRVDTEQLCVGAVCVTSTQFLQMVEQTTGSTNSSGQGQLPTPTPIPTPTPTPGSDTTGDPAGDGTTPDTVPDGGSDENTSDIGSDLPVPTETPSI